MLIQDTQKTRFNGNPGFKNTFEVIQSTQGTPIYISEEYRFRKNSRNTFLEEEKSHKDSQHNAKLYKIKKTLQDISEKNFIKEFVGLKKDKCSLIHRTCNKFVYENVIQII